LHQATEQDSRILIHLMKTAYAWITTVIHEELVCIRYHVVAQYISPAPESWSRREASESRRQLVLAVALGARSDGQWRVAGVASQVEHLSITVV
jgi:hypothetical protein